MYFGFVKRLLRGDNLKRASILPPILYETERTRQADENEEYENALQRINYVEKYWRCFIIERYYFKNPIYRHDESQIRGALHAVEKKETFLNFFFGGLIKTFLWTKNFHSDFNSFEEGRDKVNCKLFLWRDHTLTKKKLNNFPFVAKLSWTEFFSLTDVVESFWGREKIYEDSF